MTSAGRRSVLDALFDDLDDETRQRFGLAGGPGVTGSSEPASAGPDKGERPAVGLRNLRGADVVAIARGTIDEASADRVTVVAGGITFFGLLSLFPAITAFVSIYGMAADAATITRHLSILDLMLPQGAVEIIRDQVETIAASPGTVLSLTGMGGLLAAFYSATGGIKSLLSALNVALFQAETRGFVRLNLVAMSFTLSGLLILALMLGAVAVIPAATRWLPMEDVAKTLVTVLRWPAMLLMLVVVLVAVYRWGPAAPDNRRRPIVPGAVLAAVALVLVSMLFGWYAANFANFNRTYGSLGAVVALMTWLWLSAAIVLVGAELNAEIERHRRRLNGDRA